MSTKLKNSTTEDRFSQGSANGEQNRSSSIGRPGPVIAIVLLCGPIALLAIPAFWWVGYTLLQAWMLTTCLQLLVALIIVAIRFYRSYEDDDEVGRSEKDKNAPRSELHIWKSYSHPDLYGQLARIALIAQDSVQSHQIARDLAQEGYEIHHTTDIDAMLETVQTRPFDWDFMIFDLDLFDDLESRVDELISFRENCAKTPVLLLSGSVSKDDLSDHRRAIGDATLRKPVFRNRLLAAVNAIRTN